MIVDIQLSVTCHIACGFVLDTSFSYSLSLLCVAAIPNFCLGGFLTDLIPDRVLPLLQVVERTRGMNLWEEDLPQHF